MPLEIELGTLLSRAKRTKITGGSIRKISTQISGAIKTGSEGDGGLLGWIAGGLKRFVGFLLVKLWELIKKVVSWSFTTVAQWLHQTFNFLWNFDWAKTDAELDEDMKKANDQLMVQAAGTLGGILGWLAGGVVPGLVCFVFNEPLGVYVLNRVGQEAIEEMLPVMSQLLRSSLRVATRSWITNNYKFLRKLIIGAEPLTGQSDEDINKEYAQKIDSGELTEQQAIDEANKRKRIRDAALQGFERKPFVFQKGFEEWREANVPKNLKDAAEELVEEFSDNFWEAFYVFAGALDGYVASQKVTAPSIIGQQSTVVIDFDRNDDPTPTPTPSPNPSPTPTPPTNPLPYPDTSSLPRMPRF